MARFFLHRPVLAIVLSLAILIAGAMALKNLPVAQYPQISPPTVTVSATYPGANAAVVEQAVAIPIEQQINGTPNMLYMSSNSFGDGSYSLTCTFQSGTNLELAAVDVQNRVKSAEGTLPAEVITSGVTVQKQSSGMVAVISIYSPQNSYDEVYLSNYTSINIVNQLSRVPGVGGASIVGRRDYAMRIWVRPDKLAKLGLTASDISSAIQSQNVQAPSGAVGQPPAPPGTDFEYPVDIRGRLSTKQEYDNIVVRTLADGSLLRLRDVARTELAARTYSGTGRLNGSPSTLIIINQSPGSNALAVLDGLRSALERAKATFPPGLDYSIAYDSTLFISSSIREVTETLFEALLLVVAVVFVFLGSFRATLIPILAIPVSLVGTFAIFIPLGFTINTLTLFGLVLAIGIVVDDAIVVVEAVEHHMRQGLDALAATERAMDEVSGPVVGIALVLIAVFVPVAFLGGITGELYRQFALTLSVSVLLSALVALTLTPALCRLILRPPPVGAAVPTGVLARALDVFNRLFDRTADGYTRWVGLLIRHSGFTLLALAAVGASAYGLMRLLPTSFVPAEDQGMIIASFNLPEGASTERTDAVMRRAERFLATLPAVSNVVTMGGMNMLSGGFSSNAGSLVVTLKPWDERKAARDSSDSVVAAIQKEFTTYPEGTGLTFVMPPIPGLGSTGGFQFELQDRQGSSPEELARVAAEFAASAAGSRELTPLYSSFGTSLPMIDLDLNRDKVESLGIPMRSVFDSLQILLGGLQVGDFNLYGRTYGVMLQAEPEFRASAASIGAIHVRGEGGEMIPLSTLLRSGRKNGAGMLQRFNLYRTAEISGAAAPGISSGQALDAMERLASSKLPRGFGFEWSGLALQERAASGTQALIFGLALVFVFLVLAALYESWAIPAGILLGLPVGIFGAFLGTLLRGLDNSVYVQIGLVMLLGLTAKNAILIVEFARMKRDKEHLPAAEAALAGARLRFRPILMTSLAFILGVVPLMVAQGAGSAARHSLGTAVFSGMLAATVLGVQFVPVLYVVIERLLERFRGNPHPAPQPLAKELS
jgi:HAE1 family hydrophobic/amphiphilic exporter-1/multidrug efflux pump